MSYLWTPPPSSASRLPYCQFTAMDDTEAPSGFVLVDYDASSDVPVRTPVPVGTLVILDWGSWKQGPLQISKLGVDSSCLRYFGEPSVQPPTPEHKDGFGVLLLFQDYGLRSYSANGVIAVNAFRDLQNAFARSPEGQAGKLAVYILHKSKAIFVASRAATFFGPVLRLHGWLDRPELFGPRKVPAPKPVDFAVLTGPARPPPPAMTGPDPFAGLQSAARSIAEPAPSMPEQAPVEADEIKF